MRTRRKVYASPPPAPRPKAPPRTFAAAPQAPEKPHHRRRRRPSLYYAFALVLCALLHGVSITLYAHACGLHEVSLAALVSSLATAGSPFCSALASLSAGLANVYTNMWIHVVGVALMRTGELSVFPV